jgi:Recombination endonuclease VII
MPLAVNGKKACSNKECEHGGEPQPVGSFDKNSGKKDGLNHFCKDCRRRQAGSIRRVGDNRAKDGRKICSRKSGCIHDGAPQEVSNFQKNKNTFDGYMSQCKDCCRLHQGSVHRQLGEREKDGRKVCCRESCIHGRTPQPVSNFSGAKNAADGYSGACKDCLNAHYKNHGRSRYLLRNFGITLDEFNSMLLAQNNLCDSCGGKFSDKWSSLDYPHTHHDHITGEIVGILHCGCNLAEGNIQTSRRAFALAKRMYERELVVWASALFNRVQFLAFLKAI